MSNYFSYDWKKYAATTTMEDNAIERAFMDQSYVFIQNKAGKLMQDPYRLGFELVAKNDDSSRMIGIYGFRVNGELLYAPVFFLSGEIKGTDLLYRTKTKKFVPLNEEWVNFIVEKSDLKEGQAIDRHITRKSPANLQLQRLAYPTPMGVFKMASEDAEETHKWFSEIVKQAKAFTGEEKPKALRNFLTEAGPDMFNKLAAHMIREYPLANAIVSICDEEDFMPPDLIENVKQASAKANEVKLRLVQEMEPGIRVEDFCKRGFQIIDTRPSEAKSTVYVNQDNNVMSIGSPGLCNLLTKNGDRIKVFVFLDPSRNGLKDYPYDISCQNSGTLYGFGVMAEDYSDFKKGTLIKIYGDPIFGDVIKSVSELKADEDLKTSMEPKKLYLVVNLENGTAKNEPIYCLNKTQDDGVITYKYCNIYGQEKTLTHNEDYDQTDNSNDIFGQGTRFIELNTDKNKEVIQNRVYNIPQANVVYASDILGNGTTIMNWILKSGAVVPLTVTVDDIGDFSVRFGNLHVDGISKKQAAFGLAAALGIDGVAAEEIVETAEERNSASYFVELSKSAGAIRIDHEPEFREAFNSLFNVPEQNPQGFVLRTVTENDYPKDHRIGDAYNPNFGGYGPAEDSGISVQQLMTSSPEELAEVAKTLKSPSVFEHGVIGALASTYDASALMDTYIGKMQEALDALGRSLFLFYWKPKDFEESYGVDDMQNMEHKLLSSFKQFGELVLDLLKKTHKNKLKSVNIDRN